MPPAVDSPMLCRKFFYDDVIVASASISGGCGRQKRICPRAFHMRRATCSLKLFVGPDSVLFLCRGTSSGLEYIRFVWAPYSGRSCYTTTMNFTSNICTQPREMRGKTGGLQPYLVCGSIQETIVDRHSGARGIVYEGGCIGARTKIGFITITLRPVAKNCRQSLAVKI